MWSLNILTTAACFLLLSSMAVAQEPTKKTRLETLNSTWDQLKQTATSVQVSRVNGQISDFRCAFVGYEKRIKSFVENVRRGYVSMKADASDFLAELRGYVKQLPKNETNIVMKYRSRCDCEGQTYSPCPDRCMDSCYTYDRYNRLDSYDNCTEHGFRYPGRECNCYFGSSTSCVSGIRQCYEEKAEVVPDNKPCMKFAVDQSMLEGSFLRSSDLLLEPLKILVRDLDFQVSSFKQEVIATDLLSTITSHLCEEQDPGCFPEATQLLEQKLGLYKQRKRNITLEMVRTQEQAEMASRNIHVLKEQMFAQISQSIRKYGCCLKSLNFPLQDNDCNPKPIEIATTTMRSREVIAPLLRYIFLCENRNGIPSSFRCDGDDDCGDRSDEANCDNSNTTEHI